MSRDKQIDEMVKVMCGNREAYKTCKSCKLANVNAIAYCRIEHYAECLAKEGYRKASVGEWIMEKFPLTKCSVCGTTRNCETEIGWNYCPNCGAKMKGD